MKPVTLATELAFPEGPAFDSSGALWCVELRGGRLWRRTREGEVSRWDVGGSPNGLAIDASDRLWFCDAARNEIRVFDQADGSLWVAADTVDGHRLDAPNDLAFDSAGNLIFTCPGGSRDAPTGYVCCRRPDGRVLKIASGLQFPNGVAVTSSGAGLLVAETRRQQIWMGRWDSSSASWQERRPIGPASAVLGPDGLAVDDRERVYAAIYGAGYVEIRTLDGAVLEKLATPGRNPTNCAFDPAGPLGLVVTEAERGEVLSFPGVRSAAMLQVGPARSDDQLAAP